MDDVETARAKEDEATRDAEALGARLRDERVRQGLSMAALAYRAGIVPTRLGQLEHGRSEFGLCATLRALGLRIELRRNDDLDTSA